MNKKNLDIVLKVLQKKYPFIKDIKYAWRTEIGGGYDVDRDHNFTIYINLNQLRSLFPDATIDYTYLHDNYNLVGVPTMAFNEYYDNRIGLYGKDCRRITVTLLKTIIPPDDSSELAFCIEL